MKGGGRGKEPSVAGEVTGKRPKRKCLQWHPLLSKKALDFSEEEEEEDEEELEKVSVSDSERSLNHLCPQTEKHVSLWDKNHATALHLRMYEFVISSQCCVTGTRGRRCSVEAQQKKWRRTQTNSGLDGQ